MISKIKKQIIRTVTEKFGCKVKDPNDIVYSFPENERKKVAKTIKTMEDNEELVFDETDGFWKIKNLVTNSKKEEKEEIKEFSFLEKNGKIYEQVYNPKNDTSRFVTLDKKPVFLDEIEGIKPIDFINKEESQAVLLPRGIRNFRSIQDLIKDIQEHIQKYLDISEEFKVFASYYVLLSWVYDRINTLPYLRALGDTGTGKSRFLDVIGRLCYKATIVSGAITPAPIYRMIRRWNGTIIIDEGDRRYSHADDEVVKILNCGFEKNRPVIRCNKDNPNELEFLPTFCPKVIATRYTFRDKALESRCLTETMKETSRKNIPKILPDEFFKEEETLREKLLMFRLRYRNKIDTNKIQSIDLGDIEPRLEQATLSFAVLFVNIPEVLDKFKEFLQKYNQELVEERSNSFEGTIINAIFNLKNDGIQDISASDIINKLGLKDKIKSQKIGKHLKSLNIKTQPKRIEKGTRRCIVWNNNLMEQLKKKYIPVNETIETNETHETENENVSSATSVSNVSCSCKEISNKNSVLNHLKKKKRLLVSKGELSKKDRMPFTIEELKNTELTQKQINKELNFLQSINLVWKDRGNNTWYYNGKECENDVKS